MCIRDRLEARKGRRGDKGENAFFGFFFSRQEIGGKVSTSPVIAGHVRTSPQPAVFLQVELLYSSTNIYSSVYPERNIMDEKEMVYYDS